MVTSAMQVVLAGEAIREKLLSKLKSEIAATAASENWFLDWTVSGYSRYSGFSIDFSKRSSCVFRVEFDRGQYNGVAYGAYKKDNTATEDGGARAALFAAKLNSSNGSAEDKHWPWWAALYHPKTIYFPLNKTGGLAHSLGLQLRRGRWQPVALSQPWRRFRDALASTED